MVIWERGAGRPSDIHHQFQFKGIDWEVWATDVLVSIYWRVDVRFVTPLDRTKNLMADVPDLCGLWAKLTIEQLLGWNPPRGLLHHVNHVRIKRLIHVPDIEEHSLYVSTAPCLHLTPVNSKVVDGSDVKTELGVLKPTTISISQLLGHVHLKRDEHTMGNGHVGAP